MLLIAHTCVGTHSHTHTDSLTHFTFLKMILKKIIYYKYMCPEIGNHSHIHKHTADSVIGLGID